MNHPVAPLRSFIRPAVLAAIAAALCASAQSQTPPAWQPPQTVQWHATVRAQAGLQPGQHASIELTGQILQGWHVYGLEQHRDGPTELRFAVEDNPIVQAEGAPHGSPPVRRMDPGFGFEIQYYTDSLELTLPIQVKPRAGAGKQQVPVSVRFQSCSERTCLPPATIHLLVDVNVQPHG